MSKELKRKDFFKEITLPIHDIELIKTDDCILMTIDGSTQQTGVSFFINGKLWKVFVFGYLKNSKIDIDTRTSFMIEKLFFLLNEYKPYIIYMEDTYQGKNAKSYKYLCRMQGAVYGWTFLNKEINSEFNLIYPSEWRKDLGFEQGKKKRQDYKIMAIEYIKNILGIEIEEDAAESICIGLGVLKHFSLYNKNQIE